jgi:hypothetical protein
MRALVIARAATPASHGGVDPKDPLAIPAGTRVRVIPTDYGEFHVDGELVATTVQSMSLLRRDPMVGEVVVHFPKIGYEIEAI